MTRCIACTEVALQHLLCLDKHQHAGGRESHRVNGHSNTKQGQSENISKVVKPSTTCTDVTGRIFPYQTAEKGYNGHLLTMSSCRNIGAHKDLRKPWPIHHGKLFVRFEGVQASFTWIAADPLLHRAGSCLRELRTLTLLQFLWFIFAIRIMRLVIVSSNCLRLDVSVQGLLRGA